MKEISIWKDTVSSLNYSSLQEDSKVDVLIIGGGITGVSTLYYLRKSNLKVMLVEQNKVGGSVTGNSTGKLTFLQNDLLDKIRKNFGDDKASLYIKSQREAIDSVIHIVDNEKIDCDLEKVDSYLYTNQNKEIDKLKKLENFLGKCGINIKEKDINFIDSKYLFGVDGTYLFHPIKFIHGLLKTGNYSVYENTSIQRIEKDGDAYLCYTNTNLIRARFVVIASHYPYFMLPFLFPIKANLEKSYLSASRSTLDRMSLISYSYPFISIRSYCDYLIYLSNSHSPSRCVNDKKNYEELIKKISDLGLVPEYLWSNIDVMTNDGLPYIGRFQDNMFIGTGYNTWGLTNGVLAGKIVSDLILGKDNVYTELFSPKRMNLSQITEGTLDGIKTIEGYVNGYLAKQEAIFYEKREGKNVMVYKDKNGEHVVLRNCPHVGCRLIFNEIEKTWDCPCHGSRFDLDGRCISGPANRDIVFHGNN